MRGLPNAPARTVLFTFEVAMRWNWKMIGRTLRLMAVVLLSNTVCGNEAASDEAFVLGPSQDEPALEVVNDLRLDLLLREPTVANPLYLSFDERGRLWVVQYRQYPWPAGLKLLSRDNVWRNVYDPPAPPPPPHASDSSFRGADRISIHEDTDGDGTFDSVKVFLDGLNFATAALVGRGGVFVLNPPYLLFYADHDRDDQPDSLQPELLLSGFGIEDSHSIANSLRWGPDGWIYAAQGSTVSGAVVVHGADGQPVPGQAPVHSLGQNIWRYHPETRRYEVFAEGGGNTFGVEIDAKGRVYSGHNGGDTRGFYYVQGGYSQKNFGKHGQLSNPFAFDYYRPMRHHSVVRFTHTFCIYEADSLPARYHERLLGVNPVEHDVVVSEIGADGASRRTRDLAVIVAPGAGARADWFTPVDIQLGPDGALYVADWYSVQPNHYRNHEGQTNPDLGRIYRLCGADYRPWQARDLAALSSVELIEGYLFHPNRWFRQTALRLLGDRRDEKVAERVWTLVQEQTGQAALEALWALNLSGGLNAARAERLLTHADPHVRRWTIRLIGDSAELAAALAAPLLAAARDEPDVETRCQLAATAKRLPAGVAVPLVFELARRNADVDDLYVPNMLWWALEAHADHPELMLAALRRSDSWQADYRVGGYRIPQNLMRRYAAAGRQSDLEICGRLLQLAPDGAQRELLVEAFVKSFEGRALPVLPASLASALAQSRGPFALQLAVRQRDLDAIEQACETVADASRPVEQRLALIDALGDVGALPEQTARVLQELLITDENVQIKNAALLALQKLSDGRLPEVLLAQYAKLPAETREVACSVLASRATWAEQLLAAIDRQVIQRSSLDAETVQRLYRHPSPTIQELLARLYPQTQTPLEQREARIDAIEQIVRHGQGDPLRGRELFRGKATCVKCHTLFAEGGEVGPELTSYNRSSLRRMLLAIVHPSAEIREGFGSFTVVTDDGRVLSGLKIEHNDNLLILRGSDGQDQVIPTPQIEELIPNQQSLMPEALLDQLSDEEVRDLFAYLTSTTPPL
jgi:putative membrane-bound dehydrogenase-like protein